MISIIKGIVELRDDPYVVIDVAGVGYKILATIGVLATAHLGTAVKIFTYTHVREDLLELYGFEKYQDLKLFEQLISVSGIGPKTALGVFTLGSGNQIAESIMNGDVDFFTGVPRLGKKNAQKLIIELKGKMGSTVEFDLSDETSGESGEVMAALKTFGFSSREAADAIKSLDGEIKTVEEKIRKALKYLGK